MKKLNIKKISSFLLLSSVSLLCVTGCKTATRYSRSTGEAWDDKTIARNVRRSIRHENALDKTDIKVTSFRGNVTLSGYVNHASQRDIASAVTRDTEGVEWFQNNISVKDNMPMPRKSPPSLTEAAGAAPAPPAPAMLPGHWERGSLAVEATPAAGRTQNAQSGNWQSGPSRQYTTEPAGAQPAKKDAAPAPQEAPAKPAPAQEAPSSNP